MALARNSYTYKQQERYEEALKYYQALMKSYPETKYKKEVDKFYEEIQENLKESTEAVSK